MIEGTAFQGKDTSLKTFDRKIDPQTFDFFTKKGTLFDIKPWIDAIQPPHRSDRTLRARVMFRSAVAVAIIIGSTI